MPALPTRPQRTRASRSWSPTRRSGREGSSTGTSLDRIAVPSFGRIIAIGGGIFGIDERGGLDPTFADGGRVAAPRALLLEDVIATADDRVVVGGLSLRGMMVLRFLPDGAYDPDFGDAGRVEIAQIDRARSVAELPGGGIVAVGATGLLGFVHWLAPDGTGLESAHRPRTTWVDVAADPGARVLVAGELRGDDGGFDGVVFARYRPR